MINVTLLQVLPDRQVVVKAAGDNISVGQTVCLNLGNQCVLMNCEVLLDLGFGNFLCVQTTSDTYLCVVQDGSALNIPHSELALEKLLEASADIVAQDKQILRIMNMFRIELNRAMTIHPKWTSDAVHAAGILGEESGEALQAAVDFNASGSNNDLYALCEETVQTGAMCIRLILNMDRFSRPINKDKVLEILSDAASPQDKIEILTKYVESLNGNHRS